ncbi:hypothetical protein [Nonomuraea rhodomycinica]|nr:hypothetical protein [Nonomuraea rhodomycinica]
MHLVRPRGPRSLISVVPLVIAFIVLQRHWRSGLSAGSRKA